MLRSHLLALLILQIPLAACTATAGDGNPGGTNSSVPEVENRAAATISDRSEALNRWQKKAVFHYRFQSSLQCYCLPETRAPRIIEVNNDQVTAIRLAGSGKIDPDPPELLDKTISQWFDYLGEQAAKEMARVSGTFLADSGFPSRISVDRHPRMADDEFSVVFSDFKPTQPD